MAQAMQEVARTIPQGMFCWNELATTDVEAAKQFYSQLLGWSTNELDMGRHGTYTVIHAEGQPVGGIYHKPQGNMPPHWMSYVHVDDVDSTAARVEELGGKVRHAPADIRNVGRFAVIEDPTGAVIALFKGVPQPAAAR